MIHHTNIMAECRNRKQRKTKKHPNGKISAKECAAGKRLQALPAVKAWSRALREVALLQRVVAHEHAVEPRGFGVVAVRQERVERLAAHVVERATADVTLAMRVEQPRGGSAHAYAAAPTRILLLFFAVALA